MIIQKRFAKKVRIFNPRPLATLVNSVTKKSTTTAIKRAIGNTIIIKMIKISGKNLKGRGAFPNSEHSKFILHGTKERTPCGKFMATALVPLSFVET